MPNNVPMVMADDLAEVSISELEQLFNYARYMNITIKEIAYHLRLHPATVSVTYYMRPDITLRMYRFRAIERAIDCLVIDKYRKRKNKYEYP